jgi:hypothetical protein
MATRGAGVGATPGTTGVVATGLALVNGATLRLVPPAGIGLSLVLGRGSVAVAPVVPPTVPGVVCTLTLLVTPGVVLVAVPGVVEAVAPALA